uniref:DNA-binding response regulator n=1 Tax=Cryptomonas sp. CCAC 1634B TaxID=2051848 RepID=A0A679C9Z5_9CRYP|nr:DNA-binding response regulator [Cryptomonas sp. CCAC 1634B]
MVDAELQLSATTKKYFLYKAIRIITVDTVEHAWDMLRESCPDVIIVDVAVLSLRGDVFIQELLQHRTFRHIPIVFLTAKGLVEDRVRGYTSGYTAYLSKPFDLEELESIIRSVIDRTSVSLTWILWTHRVLHHIRVNLRVDRAHCLVPAQKPHLTPIESIVLTHILRGKQTSEIASVLHTSHRHVEQYITRLLDKTFTSNTLELRGLPWRKLLQGE